MAATKRTVVKDFRAEQQAAVTRMKRTQNTLTRGARKSTLQQAANGNPDAIEQLRCESPWFPKSTACFQRDPMIPPASDAEIRVAAAAFLAQHYPETRTTRTAPARPVARPSLNPSAIYKARAEQGEQEPAERVEERRRRTKQQQDEESLTAPARNARPAARTFAQIAAAVYGGQRQGDGEDLITSSGRGGGR